MTQKAGRAVGKCLDKIANFPFPILAVIQRYIKSIQVMPKENVRICTEQEEKPELYIIITNIVTGSILRITFFLR